MGWRGLIAIMMSLATSGCAAQAVSVSGADTTPSAKAYLVAEIAVTDAAAYQRYAAAAGPIIAGCGGRYLARGGRVEGLEGAPPEPRFVIVEFSNFDAARACYFSPAYQAVAPLRRAASRSRFWLSEGLPQ